MSLRLGLLSILAAAPLMFAGQQASATAYTFSSSPSTFTTGSDHINNSTNTEIGWGGSGNINTGRYDGSTISSVTVNGSGNTTSSSPVQVGALSWDNEETEGSSSIITASYKLVLNFFTPAPGGTSSPESIALQVTNTPNGGLCFLGFGCVDDKTTVNPATASINIDGLVLSNFTFSGTGFNASTGIWSNPEDNIETLKIFAKITDAPTSVPEPGSLAVLGTALAGLGLVRLRKRATQAGAANA